MHRAVRALIFAVWLGLSFQAVAATEITATDELSCDAYLRKGGTRPEVSYARYAPLFQEIAKGNEAAEISLIQKLDQLPFATAYDDMLLACGGDRCSDRIERLISRALSQHPAGISERAPLLRNARHYFDEILGLPRAELEGEEKVQAYLEGGEKKSRDLGVGMPHDFWFSYPTVLSNVLEIAISHSVRTVTDLGCGTGRLGLYLGFVAPEIRFKGLEIYRPRVQAAQEIARRWGFSDRVEFTEQDLLDGSRPFPVTDLYFIYGPTNDFDINRRVIERLEPIGRARKIVIVTQHYITKKLLEGMPWLRRESGDGFMGVFVSIPGKPAVR